MLVIWIFNLSGNTRLHIKQQKRKRNRPTFGGFAGRKLTEAASFWRWHNVLGCQEVWRRSVRDWKFSGKEGARTGGTMEDGKKGKTKECSKVQIVSTTSTAFLLGIYYISDFWVSGKILNFCSNWLHSDLVHSSVSSIKFVIVWALKFKLTKYESDN